MRRIRVRGSIRAFAVRKPIDKPSMAPARSSESSSRPRITSGIRRPRAKKTAVIFAQFEPDADRLGWVVLKQHRNAPEAPRRKRIGKSSAHDHVTRLIDFAEQAGVAFDGAVSIDRCSRGKNGGDCRFG